jgi:translocation and assembly module TamB
VKTTRTHRRLATIALVLLVVAATGASTTWWVISTDRGSKWGFERLGAILPGKLKIRQLDGPIRSPLVVHDVSYASDRVEITAETVAITWRLQTLFQKRLDISSFAAKNMKVTFHFKDVMPDTTGLPDVDLPVSIFVRKGTIDSLRVYGVSVPPETALAIDHVSLASSVFRDTLGIQELTLTSRTLDAKVVGTLLPKGDYPLDVAMRWRYRTPAGVDVVGGGTFKGSVARLDVVQNIDRPFTAHLVGRQSHAFARGQFTGEGRVSGLKPRDLFPDAPQGVWSGTGKFAGIPDQFAGSGTAEGTGTQWGHVRAQGKVTRDKERWSFSDVFVNRPGQNERILAHGTVQTVPDGPARVDGHAEWRNVSLPIAGSPGWSSQEGRVTVRGTMAAYDVRADGTIQGPQLDATRFTMRGRGDSTHVRVSDVRANLLAGRVQGHGTVAWSPGVRWDFALEGSHVNPGARWRDWPGSLGFSARTDGRATASGARGRVRVPRLDGTLRGYPVEGHGGFAYGGGSAVVDTLDVHVETAHLTGTGAVLGPWNFTWTVDAPRLGALVPTGAGVVSANGTITGSREEPRAVAHVLADTIAAYDLRVTRLVGDFDVSAAPSGPFVIDVHGDGLAWRSRHADSLSITGRGTGGAHTVALRLDSVTEAWRAALAGGFARGDWRGALTALDLTSQRVGNWALAASAPLVLAVSSGWAELGNLTWRSGGSSLTANGSWRRGEGWKAHTEMDSLRLAMLEPILSRDFRLEGRLDGTIDARTDAAGALTLVANLAPGPGQLGFLGGTMPDSVSFGRGVLQANIGPPGTSGNFAMTFAGTDQVAATLALPGFRRFGRPDPSQPVGGTLRAEARDLRFAQALFTDIAETRGRLDADLALAGTMGSPQLSGHLDLDSARAVVPRLGITLTDVDLHLKGQGGRQMALTGSMASGPGRVALDGQATLANDGTPKAALSIQGNRFLVAGTEEVRLIASPDLKASLEGNRAEINGEIRVPEGAVNLVARKPIVRPSLDVHLVTANPDSIPPKPGLLVQGEVRVILGDSVRVAGQGLKGRSTGQVLVIKTWGGPTRGSGELTLEEGTYDAYGQSFKVERGRLLFAGGPITNPWLDLRASRAASSGVTAGFEVRGTLEHPQMTVFSDPAMPDNEALAYALTGQPLTNVSQGQSALIAEAAASFALQQTNVMAADVAKGFGLTEMRLQAGQTLQQTSLFFGTQITPKLFLGYGLGLFETLNMFRLRYLLSSSWTLEAESAKENRANLLFSREY